MDWTGPTVIAFESEPGDPIGLGQTYRYTQADAIISVSALGSRLGATVQGDEEWTASFVLPRGHSRLEAGRFEGMTREPFHGPETGGMSWTGEGRGCNELVGWLQIDSVAYIGDVMNAVAFRFEQHCEGGDPAGRGTVFWRAADPTMPPGPVHPAPSNLWQPDPGTIPASGDYAYLESDPDDWIGRGASGFVSIGTVEGSGRRLTITQGTAGGWVGQFEAMVSIERFVPGYYPALQRHGFHNPAKGGLSWSGQGRGCNTSIGWLVVDQVAYSGNQLTGIALRFEQRCDSGDGVLHMAIRWGL